MSIPNIISIFRMILIPFIIAFLFLDFTFHYYIALGLYILAMLSDLVDGYIARKYKLETELGRFLDPLADKMLNVLMIVTLTFLGIFPLWIALLQIARDLVVDAIINLQASLKMFNSAILGAKLRTLLIVVAVSVGIFALINNDQTFVNAAYYIFVASFIIGFFGIWKPIKGIGKTILKKWGK